MSDKIEKKKLSGGVKIDQYLTWQHHINDLPVKLSSSNDLLFKIKVF